MNSRSVSRTSTLDEVLITSELDRRPTRAPDYEAENRALVALAAVMAESPKIVFQKLADAALELCRAGSAGVSVWERGGPENVFRWQATAGEYARYNGHALPRHFSPCGAVLDRGRHLLMADPVRFFPYIEDLCSPVREVLLVPFHQGGEAVGTVWVVSHAPDVRFDAEDARIVGSLTRFAGAAVQALARIEAAEATQNSLRISEERLTAALRTARMCAWSWDPSADRIIASDTAAVVYGLKPGENLENSRFGFGLIHPEDVERHRALVRGAVERGESWHAEFRIVRPVDGRVAWLEERATAERDPISGAVRMTGLVWDVTDRKLTEAESTQLASRLALALDAARLGTWEWDPTTDGTILSDRAGAIFGVEPGVPHDREKLRRLLHPDDRERARSAAARAVAERSDYEIEYRLDRPETATVWIAAHGRGTYDPAGNLVRMHGVVQDVTGRKRAEETVTLVTAESERRRRLYEAVLSSTPDLAYVWGLDHRFTYANEGLLRMWGKTWDEAIGKNCLELGYEPWHAEMHGREIELVRATKKPFRGEVPFSGTFGRRVYDYILVPVIGADGEVEAVAGTTRDVTDRKVSEEGLKKQTERLRLLWEAASVLLTTDDPDAMIRGLFDRIAGHFGLDTYFNFMVDPSGDFLRLESCAGIPAESAESIRKLEFGQAVCGAVARSRVPITATDIQGSDDPRVQLVKGFGIRAYACNPLIAGDRLLGTLSFASRERDSFDPDEIEFLRTVCHYVTVAYERLRLVRELRDQDRKKDDFIALLAHELRNPLAPIRNGLQVMRLAGGDPAAPAKAREMMDRQLGHMVRLIDDLLDVSRINRNKMDLRRSRVALSDVVAAAVETARPALDSAGHELTLALPAAAIVLDADLTRLAQVFANLLTNSAKYTPPGGRVWLSADLLNDRVTVSVRDTGIGIPANALPAVFDMFSQVDRSIERSTGGLGIGLALVKGLVEMHGGTVAATSGGEGQGCEFVVSLPVAAARLECADTATDAPPARRGRRFLVVDDNRDGAESLGLMLGLGGHRVETAYNGIEAVSRAEQFRPDVILMDVGMPRLNGLDATRQIRATEWGRTVKIVALTGWGQETDRARSREAGCDGHLVKPVGMADLEKLLAELDVPRN